ncbi:MAG: magnesium/cobalt transporter CorA [Candidatus Altiarchaeota archaeon]
MKKLTKKRSRKSGMPPGSLVHIGDRKIDETIITVIDYDESKFQEKTIKEIHECSPFTKSATVSWINIIGIHDIEVLRKIGDMFNMHPLVVEDILNTDQRPKMEDFGDYIFLVLQMLTYNESKESVDAEQISIILGPNFVLSIQETEGDVFDGVRERIRGGKGKIRKMGSDYLTYALLDAIVDNYFLIMEKVGEDIEDVEEEVVGQPTPKTLHTIHDIKGELIFLRRSVWPLREVVSSLQRFEGKLVKNSTRVYLKDVYDHIIQVIDSIESFRDIISSMLDIYLSSISNRMNEVMKVLTVIATIFIPLTFIAGVYGMNFRYMPELGWHIGYPLVLSLMLFIALSMLAYFKRLKWI